MRATISECGKYRYLLTRDIGLLCPEKAFVVFVMLNPSTADAMVDDPTIRRCMSFAKRWDYAGLTVINLYALRATDPMDLWRASDPTGPENDSHIKSILAVSTEVVCAWGNNAKPGRVREFLELSKQHKTKLRCLGITKQGAPKHPLYIKADQTLQPFT